jgi:hypothetical protein
MVLLGATPVGGDERSSKAVRQFRASHPCPATGRASGPCPGYVVDHVEPLCAGGADRPANMQWQAVEDAKRKDVEERRLCAQLRKRPAP